MALILLVDDDVDILDNLGAVLRSEGYDVVTAENGQQAHEWLRQAPALPEMILLDLGMPVMDGWHFRWRQVQDPQLAKIPVVIVSGQNGVKRVAGALGVVGYLAKPVNPVGLRSTLQRIFPYA